MYCEQALRTEIRIVSAQGRQEEDDMTEFQVKYLSEVSQRLCRAGFTVQPEYAGLLAI